jgi:hypothetical protein
MSATLLLIFLFASAAVVHASDNSVEVTLEDTPQQQHADTTFRRWSFFKRPQYQDSDSQFPQWESKFKAGSDRPLGTARDTAAIKAVVPSTMPVTIRWVSRRLVVVAADCHPDSSTDNGYCLCVLEKQRSKWKLVHHYSHRWHPYTI